MQDFTLKIVPCPSLSFAPAPHTQKIVGCYNSKKFFGFLTYFVEKDVYRNMAVTPAMPGTGCDGKGLRRSPSR